MAKKKAKKVKVKKAKRKAPRKKAPKAPPMLEKTEPAAQVGMAAQVLRKWTIQIAQGQEDQLFAALREISLPMLRSQPGFVHMYLLSNHDDAQEVTYLTLFQSREQFEQALASQEWKEALKSFEARGFQISQPRTDHYDIIAQYPELVP